MYFERKLICADSLYSIMTATKGEEMANDRVYKCLNPVGMQVPVKTYPLAPRLDTIDGKEIWISIMSEPDVWTR